MRTAGCDAEAGHHLVQDQEHAVLARELARRLEPARLRGDHAHVAGDRLDDEARDPLPMPVERALERGNVVERDRQRQRREVGWDAGASGDAEGQDARSRLDEQRVDVAVVAALDLEDAAAVRGGAGEPNRRHRGLGSGGHKAHLLARGYGGDHAARELGFELGRRAEGRPLPRLIAQRRDHARVGVTDDQRTPRAEVVDVVAAVGVGDDRAVPLLEKDRRAADAAEGANGAVHTSGHQMFRLVEEALHVAAHWAGQPSRRAASRAW